MRETRLSQKQSMKWKKWPSNIFRKNGLHDNKIDANLITIDVLSVINTNGMITKFTTAIMIGLK